jgi:hypothetical protein
MDDGGSTGPDSSSIQSEDSDFEPLDIELQFEDTLPSSLEANSEAETGFEEVADFDDFLGESDGGSRSKAGFDDLAALEHDLADGTPVRGDAVVPKSVDRPETGSEPSLANELLLKIANELSSIRAELVTLKAQMGNVRPVSTEVPLPVADAPVQDAGSSGGFFDEEDDDKIALTGDELDNILSSADFTEESAPTLEGESLDLGDSLEAGLSLEPDAGSLHESATTILEDGILPESGDYSAQGSDEPVKRISLEDEPSPMPDAEEISLEAQGESAETLLKLADEGIHPITDAPEDTSYLEEPLAADESLDLGEAPIIEAPLVEPDLSEISVDLPMEGEGFELAGELPLEQAEESLPDIALDLEARPGRGAADAEGIDEGLAQETLPEFEDSEYEEVSLASESQDTSGPDAGGEESFVEFVEDFSDDHVADALAEEEVLHHEDPRSPYHAMGDDLGATGQLTHHPDDLSDNLDDNLFVDSPPDEEEIHLSSRNGLEDSAEVLSEEFDLPDMADESPATAKAPSKPPAAAAKVPVAQAVPDGPEDKLKSDIRSVLSYLDRLLESLPEEKIEEFAHSEHFDTYKKLFEELGLV